MIDAETRSAPFHNEAHSDVLFDEDYRAHIAKLDAMLARERSEVLLLRREVEKLKAVMGYGKNHFRYVKAGKQTFVIR